MTAAGLDDEVPLRIVVHGASGAGKTTTAARLASHFDEDLTSIDDAAGRTVLFDLLEHAGGSVGGRRLRTQVVTVPGHLAARSLHLVELADVVLFVVDTTPAGIGASTAAWNTFSAWRDGRDEPPVVVQLNKRDDPAALDVDLVRDLLGLDDGATVVETSAVAGEGVTMAYVWAVRAALRTDALLDRAGGSLAGTVELLQHLQRREAEAPRREGPRLPPRPSRTADGGSRRATPAPEAATGAVVTVDRPVDDRGDDPAPTPGPAGAPDLPDPGSAADGTPPGAATELEPEPARRRWFGRRRRSAP